MLVSNELSHILENLNEHTNDFGNDTQICESMWASGHA